MKTKYVVLVDCSDQKGLVHKITGVLYRHGLNVEHQDEFVQQSSKHFFMRTEVSGTTEPEKIRQEIKSTLPKDANVCVRPRGGKNIIILATKEPHCLGDILLRHSYGELEANISAVISNYPELERLVSRFDVPYYLVPHETSTREEHERRVRHIVEEYAADFLVLAKYMRILSRDFVEAFPARIVNIHHSFLPAFAGAKPYQQAFDRGVKIIGATAHFVTDCLDEGPIIAQEVIPVDHTKTVLDMKKAGRNVEQLVLANALKLVLEDRVFVHRNRTIVFD